MWILVGTGLSGLGLTVHLVSLWKSEPLHLLQKSTLKLGVSAIPGDSPSISFAYRTPDRDMQLDLLVLPIREALVLVRVPLLPSRNPWIWLDIPQEWRIISVPPIKLSSTGRK